MADAGKDSPVKALRYPLAWLVLLTPAGALPQSKPLRAASAPAFQRVSDSGPLGAVTLTFTRDEYGKFSERHARGGSFTLRALPLPGGGAADLELRPVSAFAPGARAQVVGADGSVTLLAPKVRCFAGYVVGGGPAFLGITEDEVQGYLYQGEDLFLLSSGASGKAGQATLTRSSGLGGMELPPCGAAQNVLDGDVDGSERLVITPSLRTADLFIEADNVFRSRFASDQACIDYSTLLVTAASEIYRRDIGTQLRIPDRYLRVWNTTPPWGAITGFSNLKNVYTWWQSTANPQRSLPRAAVHVFTTPIFGGTSRGVDGLCSTTRAYEISSLSGKFPYPVLHIDRYNWDLFVVCHELGHTFGSPHSFLYTPPIVCDDGSGPDSGTIMSYCHNTFGMAKVGMRFHVREQQRIRTASADAKCWTAQLLTPGDYDGNGTFDPDDLVTMEGVLRQGFRSLAAEEVFDLDANGLLDDVDHDMLGQLVYNAPPAQLLPRNGTGINPACLESLSAPLLGTTWHSRIAAPGVGTMTTLVGYDQPLGGFPTSRGELLVKTTTFGGTKLFTSSALSDGTYALHDLPLPLDSALFGRPVSFQALILGGPQGDQYCNALDVTLSPYE